MQKIKSSFRTLSLAIGIMLGAPTLAKADTNFKDQQNFTTEIKSYGLFLKTVFSANIHLSKEWDNNRPTFSANAMNMTGKVIRVSGFDYRSNSLAAFRLGLCHETGHYLAGKPYLKINASSVENTLNRMELSAEGQADYFAPYCLKKYLEFLKQNNLGSDSNSSLISGEVSEFCRNSKNHSEDLGNCEYVATAALDLVNYLNTGYGRTGQNNAPLSIADSKNTAPSSHTLDSRREYPTLNCRLRTYLAGTICDNDHSALNQFICAAGSGARPNCWYQGN